MLTPHDFLREIYDNVIKKHVTFKIEEAVVSYSIRRDHRSIDCYIEIISTHSMSPKYLLDINDKINNYVIDVYWTMLMSRSIDRRTKGAYHIGILYFSVHDQMFIPFLNYLKLKNISLEINDDLKVLYDC